VSQYQKGKTSLDLLKQDSEWQCLPTLALIAKVVIIVITTLKICTEHRKWCEYFEVFNNNKRRLYEIKDNSKRDKTLTPCAEYVANH